MSHDARCVANAIIELAEDDGISLTHLSLQKIMYFCHAWYIAEFDHPLIGQPFEAWKYGPVVRVVYDQLKKSDGPIVQKRLLKLHIDSAEWLPAPSDLGPKDSRFVRNVFGYYGRIHAGRLVDLTHEIDGPWHSVWKKAEETAVLGMVIPNHMIREWFMSRDQVFLGGEGQRNAN